MKKNVLFVLFGAVVLLTMNACKSDASDLDEELKFSKLTVEQQKAQIEKSGMDFVTAMEGMQDTKAITAITNMLEMQANNEVYAPFQKLVSDIKRARKSAISNFDKQMRVSYLDSEEWGEYAYNFNTKEIEQIAELSNKLIVKFPSTESGTKNNVTLTVTYTDSNIEIPYVEEIDIEGEVYPSKITAVMTIDGAEVMSADFSGKYYADGSPQEAIQSLTMETYKWTAEIKNDKKTMSESIEFKNGSTIIMKSSAEINGTLTEAALNTETPEDAITGIAVNFQVMNIAMKGGTTDFKKLVAEIKALSEDLSEKEYVDKTILILNKYMIATAYFADNETKFADLEFYGAEVTDTWEEWDYNQQKYVTYTDTYYNLTPRFILSDGSKVAVEEYLEDGFSDLITKIENLVEDFDY